MSTPVNLGQTATEFEFPNAVDRRHSAGNVFTNVRRRSDERPKPRWVSIVKAVAHGVAAAVLLAAGTIWTINQQHPKYVKPGELLQLPAAVVEAASPPLGEQAFRVSQVLRKYTKDTV